MPGCRLVRLAANPSRLSAPATSRVRSSVPASATASAAQAVAKALLSRRAVPSPGSSGNPAATATAMSARGARSAWPIEPIDRTSGIASALSAAMIRSASSGRTPGDPSARWLARRTIVARTTSRGASGPVPDPVMTEHPARVATVRRGIHADSLEDADGGAGAVDRISPLEARPDDRPGPVHASRRCRIQDDGLPGPGDPDECSEVEVAPAQLDGHRRPPGS